MWQVDRSWAYVGESATENSVRKYIYKHLAGRQGKLTVFPALSSPKKRIFAFLCANPSCARTSCQRHRESTVSMPEKRWCTYNVFFYLPKTNWRWTCWLYSEASSSWGGGVARNKKERGQKIKFHHHQVSLWELTRLRRVAWIRPSGRFFEKRIKVKTQTVWFFSRKLCLHFVCIQLNLERYRED